MNTREEFISDACLKDEYHSSRKQLFYEVCAVAIKEDEVALFELLAEYGDDAIDCEYDAAEEEVLPFSLTPAGQLVINGREEAALWLISKGAYIPSVAEAAAFAGQFNLVERLRIKHNVKLYSIINGALLGKQFGYVEYVEYLREKFGLDVNYVAAQAALYSCSDYAKYLHQKHNASLDAITNIDYLPDQIYKAAKANDGIELELLLALGIDVDLLYSEKNAFFSPATKLAEEGEEGAIDLLLTYSSFLIAEITRCAAYAGQKNLVEKLLTKYSVNTQEIVELFMDNGDYEYVEKLRLRHFHNRTDILKMVKYAVCHEHFDYVGKLCLGQVVNPNDVVNLIIYKGYTRGQKSLEGTINNRLLKLLFFTKTPEVRRSYLREIDNNYEFIKLHQIQPQSLCKSEFLETSLTQLERIQTQFGLDLNETWRFAQMTPQERILLYTWFLQGIQLAKSRNLPVELLIHIGSFLMDVPFSKATNLQRKIVAWGENNLKTWFKQSLFFQIKSEKSMLSRNQEKNPCVENLTKKVG